MLMTAWALGSRNPQATRVRGTVVRVRNVIVGLSVMSLLAGSSLPASAQVGDFFCSTFSIGCAPPPPPPPPAPLPVEEPPPPKRKVRKAKPKRTAAPKADAAAPASPQ